MCVRQHTQDVRVCPSAHTGRLWLSISTHISTLVLGLSKLALLMDCLGDFGPRRLSVQYKQDVCGCPSIHIGRLSLSMSVRLCPCLSVSTHRTSVASVQYTQDVCGCPSAHTRRPCVSASTHMTSVAVRVCPCVSVNTHKTYVAVHHTYRTSVGVRQHTQDVPWLSVCVRVCPSPHTGRPWLSIRIHISTLVLGLSTLALPVDCLGDFGPRGLSVQYTQDVRGCPPAHTGRSWLFVAVRVCPCLCPWVSASTDMMSVDVRGCPSAHTGRPCVSVSTHRTSHAGPSCGLYGDFGPRGLSVQYTQGARGYPPAHTGRMWLSVSTHRTSMSVRVSPCLSFSTHRTSVAVHQYIYQHAGPWTQHAGHSRGLFGTSVAVLVCLSAHRTSVAVHQYTSEHVVHTGRLWVSASTHRTSVAVRVCPCVSVSTHRTSMAVDQYTYQHYTQDVLGCPPAHIGHLCCPSAHTGRLSLSMYVRVCPCLSVSTHRTSVAVHQYTSQHDVHTGRLWVSASTHRTFRGCLCVSVCVRLCPSPHTGRPSLSIRIHISTLVLGLSTLALPVDCLGNFGPRGLSVQYTQDFRGCPPAHTGRSWLFVAVRVCPCVCPWVSASTDMTSVDVRGCPSAHTGPHKGRPWQSISTHISTLVLGLSTLDLPVDCFGDFGPHGLSVQYTQGARGCPPAHTGRLWLSVSTHRTSMSVRVCPCLSFSTHRTSVAVHQYIYQHADTGRPWVSVSTHRMSVSVRQHTQDVHGCPCVSISTQDVRGCPSVHISARWTSVGVRQHTQDVRGSPGVSVCVRQHTQDVRGCRSYTQDVLGCPPAHIGHLWLSVSTQRTSVAVHYTSQHDGPWIHHAGPFCGLFGTHRTSVAVRLCPSAYTGRLWLSISTHISTLVLGLSTLALPVDCLGDFGLRGLSVQYTQDARGTHRTSVAVHQYIYQHAGPCTQHASPSRGLFE
ncbi:hypothetical protein YC2023_066002 [Brassica napus]